MKIISRTKIWFTISLIVIMIGFFVAATKGFKYGIDFTGGTSMKINLHKDVENQEIKQVLKEAKVEASIGKLGENKEIVELKTIEDWDSKVRNKVFEKFNQKFKLKQTDILESKQFGPTMGNEIKNKAIIAIIISTIGMLIYISFRFEFSYGLAAILALVHDVLVLTATYAILNIPINSPFVAAVLTVVGYSINDTIVVFDRIRENIKLKTSKKINYSEVADFSINQTMTRSVNTSLTTLIGITLLYVFGADAIKEFTLPLIVGIATGTYSSIFIASPLWVIFKNRRKKMA